MGSVQVDGHGPVVFDGGAPLRKRAIGAGRTDSYRPGLAHRLGDAGWQVIAPAPLNIATWPIVKSAEHSRGQWLGWRSAPAELGE